METVTQSQSYKQSVVPGYKQSVVPGYKQSVVPGYGSALHLSKHRTRLGMSLPDVPPVGSLAPCKTGTLVPWFSPHGIEKSVLQAMESWAGPGNEATNQAGDGGGLATCWRSLGLVVGLL